MTTALLERLTGKREKAKVSARRFYRECVRQAVDKSKLPDAQLTQLEEAMRTLGLAVEGFDADVATAREVKRLEDVTHDYDKRAQVLWDECVRTQKLVKQLPDYGVKVRGANAKARHARESLSADYRHLHALKRDNPRIFGGDD